MIAILVSLLGLVAFALVMWRIGVRQLTKRLID